MAGSTPTPTVVHHDRPLGNFAVKAFASTVEDQGLIGHRIFPMIGSTNQSDKYYQIEKDAFFRIEGGTKRAPGTRARRVEFKISSDSFYCENYALAGENTLEALANADNPIRLREEQIELVTTQLALDQEKRIADIVVGTTNNGGSVALSGATAWSAVNSSDILGQVNTAHATIRSKTGLLPNTCVMDWDSYMVLKRHQRLRAEIFGDSAGEFADDFLKSQVLKVPNLLVGKAIKNTGVEGMDGAAETFTSGNIWGNSVWFGHVGRSTGIRTVTYGARFEWTASPGFSRRTNDGVNMTVERTVESGAGSRKVEVVEAGYFQDEKVIASDLGYVIVDSLG